MFYAVLSFTQAIQQACELLGGHRHSELFSRSALGDRIQQHEAKMCLQVDQQAIKVATVLIAIIYDAHDGLVVAGGQSAGEFANLGRGNQTVDVEDVGLTDLGATK